MDMIKKLHSLLDVLYFELPNESPEVCFWLEESQESGNPLSINVFNRIDIKYKQKIGDVGYRYLEFSIETDCIDYLKFVKEISNITKQDSYEGSFDNISNNPIIKEFIRKYDEPYQEF
jgi:hypothetical protein